MKTTVTPEQLKAGMATLVAIAEAIRELKRVPSGILYARLMGKFDLETYTKIIETLKGAGVIEETQGHELVWIGGAK